MSASRPKRKMIIPKPRGIQAIAATLPHGSPAAAQSGKFTPAASAGSSRSTPRPATSNKGRGEKEVQGKGKSIGSTAVSPISIASTVQVISSDDDEEDEDLEEVPIPTAPSSPYPNTPISQPTGTSTPLVGEHAAEDEDDEDEEEDDGVIHLEIGGETAEEKAKRIALMNRKKPMTARDRALRLEVHKVHVIALLASSSQRNRWCNDTLLKARLLSLLPHPLQAAFNIPPSRFPDRAQRSRLFFDALQTLVTWWSQTFFDISDYTLGIRTRPWDDVQEIIESIPKEQLRTFPKYEEEKSGKKGKAREENPVLETLEQECGGERLRSINSLMKKALQQEGSRDVSAQLFVSLARAAGLGARLVTSLQAVPWKAEKAGTKKKKPQGAGKGGRTVASRQGMGDDEDDEDEDELEEVPIPGVSDGEKKSNTRGAGKRRLKDPADLYRLRKYRPPPQKLGSKRKVKQDLSDQPPVFWAEIFSRPDQRWIPVDPVRGVIRKKQHYEPTSDSGPVRMLYVVAFEEDGYARDVTLRYTKNFYAKTSKLRPPTRPDEADWWSQSVMGFLRRPYRLNRDDLEDAELEMSQESEKMPQHMSGFKDHPIYVLKRHLRQTQVLPANTNPIGHFKGEPVFRRSSVLEVKTPENWLRSGRITKPNQDPLKWIKQRAVTLEKRRRMELAKEQGEEMEQGLYAEWQTEVYVPPAIVDGVIPRNSFGNIDLYAPTMLPVGAVHLPYKGIAKVAKSLNISYAEAVTGFEFKKQRAVPTLSGIVVAAENKQLVLEAYEESTAAAEERERVKREEKALKRWVKLVNGLRVRLRLREEYGGTGDTANPLGEAPDPENTNNLPRNPGGKTAKDVLAAAHKMATQAWEDSVGGEEEDAVDQGMEEVDVPDPALPRNEVKLEREEKKEQEEVEVEAQASTRPKVMLRFNNPRSNASSPALPLHTSPAPSKRATRQRQPPRQSTRAAGKRKARTPSEEEEEETSEDEILEIPETSRGKGKSTKAVPIPHADGGRRSLRSRGGKTKEQEEEERLKNERMRLALASDDDASEEDYL
ncbi:hypothetical protein L202_02261 [Cryptococcus amylolentus CBS 6039]|uniref:Xeroderma pigmentosum group C-complementing protein n=1 Tax=Cryptococcus amylolentus CBS 6039 TaxID=1295533 RepID=A0A1E3I040_9TREE|nr:hypothetical protein L202_02261 [Cryptococcus amylolentus CBS 6039]ODN81917.1 hypothetical protein L202_02261 [Cryptococcus amylolentus CBS 6039]